VRRAVRRALRRHRAVQANVSVMAADPKGNKGYLKRVVRIVG
jgi:hypothetical protein